MCDVVEKRIIAVLFPLAGFVALIAALGAAAPALAACPPLVITSPNTLPNATVAKPYSYQLTTSSSCAVTWTVVTTGPPQPSAVTVSRTGLVTGDVNEAGGLGVGPIVQTDTFTVTATDGFNRVSQVESVPVTATYQVAPSTTGPAAELTGAAAAANFVFVSGAGSNSDYGLNSIAPVAGAQFPGVGRPIAAISPLDFPDAVTAFGGGSTDPAAVGLVTANFNGTPTLDLTHFTGADGTVLTNTPVNVPGCVHPVGLANGVAASADESAAVTCPGSHSVYALSLTGPPTVTGSWSFGAGLPSGIAFLGVGAIGVHVYEDYAVADAAANTVSIIGFPERREAATTTVLLGTVNLPAGSAPAQIAWDADNGTAYVADPGINAVSQIRIAGVKTPVITITDVGEFLVGKAPFGVAYSDGTLVVTNSGDNDADVISVTAGPSLLFTPTTGTTPAGVALAPGPAFGVRGTVTDAFVANEAGGTVTEFDPPALRAGRRLAVRHLTGRRRRRRGSTHRRHRAAQIALATGGNPMLPPLPASTH